MVRHPPPDIKPKPHPPNPTPPTTPLHQKLQMQTFVQTVVSTGGGIMQRKENLPFLHRCGACTTRLLIVHIMLIYPLQNPTPINNNIFTPSSQHTNRPAG